MLFGIIEKVGVCAKRIWYSFWSLSHRPQKTAPYVVRCILDRRIWVSRLLDTRLPAPSCCCYIFTECDIQPFVKQKVFNEITRNFLCYAEITTLVMYRLVIDNYC